MTTFKCYRCQQSMGLRGECGCQDGICLIHADCRDVLPLLELDSTDLVLTDPPYGINQSVHRASLPDTKGELIIAEIVGDDSEELVAWLLGWIGDTPAVIWGASNWPHLLPHKGRWCCWDKRCNERADRMLGSAFELAWENRRSGFYMMVRVQHGGVVNADHKRFKREHPTQKPVGLFTAIIERYTKARLICDPFAGSGTTLLAAKDLGRCAIGIEIEEKYCYITAGRLGMPPIKYGAKKKGLLF